MHGMAPHWYMGNFAGAIVLGLLELIWVGNWMRMWLASSPRKIAPRFARILIVLAAALLISTLVLSTAAIGFGVVSYVIIAEFVLAITINLIQLKQVPSP